MRAADLDQSHGQRCAPRFFLESGKEGAGPGQGPYGRLTAPKISRVQAAPAYDRYAELVTRLVDDPVDEDQVPDVGRQVGRLSLVAASVDSISVPAGHVDARLVNLVRADVARQIYSVICFVLFSLFFFYSGDQLPLF